MSHLGSCCQNNQKSIYVRRMKIPICLPSSVNWLETNIPHLGDIPRFAANRLAPRTAHSPPWRTPSSPSSRPPRSPTPRSPKTTSGRRSEPAVGQRQYDRRWPTPTRSKRELLADFGGDTADYELDHVIPLAVGGHPTDPRNLVLQLWDGQDGARAKDVVEVRVKRLVCVGRITPDQGQQCFVDGWRTCPRH